jgi:hypothetical protein
MTGNSAILKTFPASFDAILRSVVSQRRVGNAMTPARAARGGGQ